jgi:hypothetical protein
MAYSKQYLDQIKQFGFTDPNEYKNAFNSLREQKIANATNGSQMNPFSKDFSVSNNQLSIHNNPMDFMGSFAPKEAPPIDMNNPFGSNQNTEVQAPILKPANNPDDGKSNFIQQYLEQSANNAMGMQGANSQNAAIDYNNRLTAGIARGANSRSKGSFTPEYQKAVAYTPQSMNFGNQQSMSPMSFGNTPMEGVPRGGTINGVPVVDNQGARLNVSMDSLRQAGTNLQANNQFVDMNNKIQTKSNPLGFTANNPNYKQLDNLIRMGY